MSVYYTETFSFVKKLFENLANLTKLFLVKLRSLVYDGRHTEVMRVNQYQRVRERAGFTQKEFAKLVGVEPSVISRYETDIAKNFITPSKERRQLMAEACGISLEFLENDDPELKKALSLEQKARFREEILHLSRIYGKMGSEDLLSTFGNTHPFRYLLRERWEPIVEDVQYLSIRYGTISDSILSSSYQPGYLGLSNEEINAILGTREYAEIINNVHPRTAEEMVLDTSIELQLQQFYSECSDDEILSRICSIASFFNRMGKISLLRLVQSWADTNPHIMQKPPQDPEDPETA